MNSKHRRRPRAPKLKGSPAVGRASILSPNKRRIPGFQGLVGKLAVAGVTLMGFFAAIDQLFGPPWPKSPVVYSAGSDPGDPFVLPFRVENKSILFPIYVEKTTCYLADARSGTTQFEDLRLVSNVKRTIRPNDEVLYRCGVHFPAFAVQQAELSLRLVYYIRVMGIRWRRSYETPSFRWVSTTSGGAWIAPMS